MATFTCDHCGRAFLRRPAKVRPGWKRYCNRDCQSRAENWAVANTTGLFRCPVCKDDLSADSFDWYERAGKSKRYSCCKNCRPKVRKSYHEHGAFTVYQRKHREKCLSAGGDVALRWYFTRNLGQYRARSQRRGVACDLDVEFLVNQFHSQDGRCYYTGEPLRWDTHGNLCARKDSMSLDRLDPARGYVKGNVVLCTYTTNTSKGERTEEDFYRFCEQVLRNRNRRV